MILCAFESLRESMNLKNWNSISHKATKTQSGRVDEMGDLITFLSCLFYIRRVKNLVCEPLYSVFQQCFTKIDQQTESEVQQFQVGE